MIFNIGRLWTIILLLFYTSNAAPSNTKSAIDEASKAGQFLFLTFFEAKDASFAALTTSIETFKKSSIKKMALYQANIIDPANKEVASKYGIKAGRDLPILLVVAPNGVITGGYSKTVTTDQLKQSVNVSGLMLKVLKPIQEQKVVLVSLQNASTKFNKETKKAADDFASDPQYQQFVSVVNADPAASGSGEFIKQCQITDKPAEATIVVLLPPGRIGGILKGDLAISKATILGALKSCSSGGGCCPPKK